MGEVKESSWRKVPGEMLGVFWERGELLSRGSSVIHPHLQISLSNFKLYQKQPFSFR